MVIISNFFSKLLLVSGLFLVANNFASEVLKSHPLLSTSTDQLENAVKIRTGQMKLNATNSELLAAYFLGQQDLDRKKFEELYNQLQARVAALEAKSSHKLNFKDLGSKAETVLRVCGYMYPIVEFCSKYFDLENNLEAKKLLSNLKSLPLKQVFGIMVACDIIKSLYNYKKNNINPTFNISKFICLYLTTKFGPYILSEILKPAPKQIFLDGIG